MLIVTAITLMSLLLSDQYYLLLQDKEIKKSNWVQNCVPVDSDGIVPAIGLFNHTHSFDLKTCSWEPTEHGIPGFLESLYISFIEPIFSDIAESFETKYAHAGCFFTDDYENRDKSKRLCSDVAGFDDVEIHDGWIAPLKQYRTGIDPYNVICNGNLVLVQKHDGSPACVTSDTKQKLVEWGWAEPTKTKIKNSLLPPCTSDRTACFDQESNICDPSGWKCENREVFSKIILLPEFNSYSTIFPYIWNDFLLRQGIAFEPKEQSYVNTDEGWYSGLNRVCSPIIASNGTEFYISSVFIDKPFEIIGTFIDSTKPDDCHKIWKTETDLPGPDIDLAVWLENHYGDD